MDAAGKSAVPALVCESISWTLGYGNAPAHGLALRIYHRHVDVVDSGEDRGFSTPLRLGFAPRGSGAPSLSAAIPSEAGHSGFTTPISRATPRQAWRPWLLLTSTSCKAKSILVFYTKDFRERNETA